MKKSRDSHPIVLALAAHPDDIEFYMAGTLLLLGQAKCELHYMTIANGSCGSMTQSAPVIRRIRRAEATEAARILGASYHPSLVNDLEIFYDLATLRRVASAIREIKPSILLVHSPQDYMEDHVNACRLAVTAAFARGMPNFETQPPRPHIAGDVTLYHAMPHGLRDPLRRRVVPGMFVDTTSTHATKRAALAAHRSQKEWLDATQGMDSYLQSMEDLSLEMGRMSGRFTHGEGWRRHLHLGFCPEQADPLRELLGDRCLVNDAYEKGLLDG